MRISFLTPGYCWLPSGGIRVVYEHANRLAARGHEVTVIQPRKRKYPPPQTEAQPLSNKLRSLADSSLELFCKPSMKWQRIDPRVKTLYAPSCDATHIPDGDVIFATAWHTVRSVLEYPPTKGLGCYLIQGYEVHLGPKELVDATWRAPLRKVAVSKWLVEVGKSLGCHDIAYVPNAIDHERYHLIRPISPRKPQVAMTFAKGAIKGADDAIEAIEQVRREHPNLKVIFFGKTTLRPSIPEWIEYHSNPPQRFIVEEIYNRSSIFLSASWSEGYALPPAEAAACGCAIVASDSGGIRDYVDNGVTGLLSPARDPSSLALNLALLLKNDDLRLRLALAARKRVAELDWERSATLLEDFITNSLYPQKPQHSLC